MKDYVGAPCAQETLNNFQPFGLSLPKPLSMHHSPFDTPRGKRSRPEVPSDGDQYPLKRKKRQYNKGRNHANAEKIPGP